MSQNLFPTFFPGGFECSTHRRHDRLPLDIINATQHDMWAMNDYQALQNQVISAARDGLRWHLIEATSGYSIGVAFCRNCKLLAKRKRLLSGIYRITAGPIISIFSPRNMFNRLPNSRALSPSF